jgi:protocatechuate 4,5-dioxygenase beta chain
MERIVGDPEALTRYTIPQLVEQAGTQGVELVNWIVARGMLEGEVARVHANYHIPISNTAAGLLVLEPRR